VNAQRPVRVLEFRMVRGTGGGPEKTILLGAQLADSARTRVTVCYLRDARDDVFAIDERARAHGVEYVEILERNSWDVGSLRALIRIIADRQIDIVHSHDYKTNLLTWLAARRASIHALSTAHGWTGHSARERYLYYPADKRLLARFPLVLAVSGEIRRELIARGARPERVRTLLNGIDPSAFRRHGEHEPAARARFGVGADEFVIGAVGRLERQKRFDLLIAAFAEVASRHQPVRLLIAGEGSARPALERQIQSLGLGDRCRLVGLQHDVVCFHHALDLFAQSSEYEGTPNAVLEAMALETPIVATDAGGTRELCEDGVHGEIVPSGNLRSLVGAIERVMTDAGRRRVLAQAARQRVEHELSFTRRVGALDDIYQTLMRAS
jgi:glycosyltransferase involved in cell wall biosynthesis